MDCIYGLQEKNWKEFGKRINLLRETILIVKGKVSIQKSLVCELFLLFMIYLSLYLTLKNIPSLAYY